MTETERKFCNFKKCPIPSEFMTMPEPLPNCDCPECKNPSCSLMGRSKLCKEHYKFFQRLLRNLKLKDQRIRRANQ